MSEPAIPQPRRMSKGSQRLRTVLLYAVATAAFIVVYQLAGSGSMPSTGVTIGIGAVLMVLLFVGIVIFNMRQIRRFNVDNNEAIALIARGEHRRAQELLWSWAERTHIKPVGALARHNLGWTLLRQGKLSQCVDVLTDNDKNFKGGLESISMYPTSAADIALAHALLGNLPDAEKWLDQADERAKGRNVPSYPGMRAFARAVIDCRAGRAADAARMLDESWAQCESLLTGENVRPLRIVRAFAHAASGPRSAGVAEQALSSARPTYPDEYSFLGVGWPEMQSFLASHDLAA